MHLPTIAANQITNAGFTYDLNGNTRLPAPEAAGNGGQVTSDGTYTYVYDGENRLKEVKQGISTIATYTYDYMGRRTSVTESDTTTYFHYDGWNVVAETDGSGATTATYTYDLNDQPISMTPPRTWGALGRNMERERQEPRTKTLPGWKGGMEMREDQFDYSIEDNWGISERETSLPVYDAHVSKDVAEGFISSSEETYWKIVTADMTHADEEHFHVRHFFVKGFQEALKFCLSMNIDYGLLDDEVAVELSPVSTEELAEIQRYFPTSQS